MADLLKIYVKKPPFSIVLVLLAATSIAESTKYLHCISWWHPQWFFSIPVSVLYTVDGSVSIDHLLNLFICEEKVFIEEAGCSF